MEYMHPTSTMAWACITLCNPQEKTTRGHMASTKQAEDTTNIADELHNTLGI